MSAEPTPDVAPSPPRSLLWLLVFVLLGHAGILLSTLSGTLVALIWLPSGVALAWLCRHGPSAVPGIVLASALVHIPHVLASGADAGLLAVVAVSLLAPVIDTAQAWIGWRFWGRIGSNDWHPGNVLRFVAVTLLSAAMAATLLLCLYGASGLLRLPAAVGLPQLWLGLLFSLALGAFVLMPWLTRAVGGGRHLDWLVPAVAVMPMLSLGRVSPLLVALALPVAAWFVVRGGFSAAAGALLGGAVGAVAMHAAGWPPLPLSAGAMAYAEWALLLIATGLPLLLLGSALDDYRAQTTELEQRVAERTDELQSALADARFLITNDLLTGALNRRHAMTVIDRELARAERYPQPLSAVLFTIDDFVRVQDTYGSQAADMVLQELSGLVQSVLRGSDMLVRWDDAQFLALLPQTGFDDAQVAAQKVRHAVLRHDFRTGGALLVSLGVAVHRPGESRGDWLTRVEQALFQAQADGGNCTVALG